VSKILNSIKQAIFAIGPQKTVVPPVSQFTRNIFERSVEGEHIQDLLFVGKAQTEDCSKVESTLDLVFGEDELNWQILKNNLPGELEIKVGETNRKLKLSYNDMRADDGNLEKILLVAEDVTAMRELEEQFRDANEARERELQIVSQVYPKDPLQLDAFFKNTSRLLAEINAMKGDFRSIKERQSKIKRHIHTIKGNARAIGFTQFSNLAHDLESQMAQYNLEEVDSLSQVGPFLDVVGAKLQAVIDEYQKVTQKFVSFQHSATGKTLANDSVKIPVGNFNRFRCRIEEWIDDERPISAEDFLAQLKGLREVPVHELIQEKRLLVDEVAKSLGKEVEFVVSGDYVTVSEGIANSLYDVLTHALRNSLDHGIETPEERVRQNKNSKGRLEVRTLREKNEIIISIIDDGRGIDTERVVKKAQGLGLLTANDVESLNQQEQLQLIFHEGLSTKEQTTEYSGRGVGMDALKSSVEALGGCVNLTSQKQIGTELHLRFPIEATLKDSRPLAS
jgi:chemotaxis protein histidine kinase CheA